MDEKKKEKNKIETFFNQIIENWNNQPDTEWWFTCLYFRLVSFETKKGMYHHCFCVILFGN